MRTLAEMINIPDPQMSWSFDVTGLPGINSIMVMAVALQGTSLRVKYLLTNGEDASKFTVKNAPVDAAIVLYDTKGDPNNTIQLTSVECEGWDLVLTKLDSTCVALDMHYRVGTAKIEDTQVIAAAFDGGSSEIIEIKYECGSVSFLPMRDENASRS